MALYPLQNLLNRNEKEKEEKNDRRNATHSRRLENYVVHELDATEEEAEMQEMLQHFSCDLVLVEGYKNAAIAKIEVWRQGIQTPIAMDNPQVVAVATRCS